MSAKWRVRVMMDRDDRHRALCRVGPQVALETLDTTGQSLLLLVNMQVSPDPMGCSHVCAGVWLTLARPYRGCSTGPGPTGGQGSGICHTPQASEPQPEQEPTHGPAVLPTSPVTSASLRTYRGKMLKVCNQGLPAWHRSCPWPLHGR